MSDGLGLYSVLIVPLHSGVCPLFESMGFYEIANACDVNIALDFVSYQRSKELICEEVESPGWFPNV